MVEKKIISTDKGKELAQKEGMPFIETSAKTGIFYMRKNYDLFFIKRRRS